MSKDSAIEVRNSAIRAKWKSQMEGDFDPGYTPEMIPKAEERTVRAVEYAAYQLGQISQRLARLVELVDVGPVKK